MAKLPDPVHEHTTATAILRWYDKQSEDPRPHLGASEIGRPCDRALWYSFRWATKKTFDPRIKRLFKTGHLEEARFLEELRGIGAEVYDRDPETNLQHRFSAVEGHFGGSCDAIGRGLPEAPKTWAIIEFKTHGEKSFNDLKAKGVEEAKPEHFAQMQVYMGLAELDRALYLACNKNTDELYSQWIHFDKSRFDTLIKRAEYIIGSDTPPPRIKDDPTWYQCKMCDHHAICHNMRVPQKNCRTCCFASPTTNAAWECGVYDKQLSHVQQIAGCSRHLYIPPLVPFGEPIDSGADFVMYQSKSGQTLFANVAAEAKLPENYDAKTIALYKSEEMPHLHAALVDDPKIAEIKNVFDAKLVEPDDVPF